MGTTTTNPNTQNELNTFPGICFTETDYKDRVETTQSARESPNEVVRQNKCIILKTYNYAYDEFFFEVDYLNHHCTSPINNRYILTYSLDYMHVWDSYLILQFLQMYHSILEYYYY